MWGVIEFDRTLPASWFDFQQEKAHTISSCVSMALVSADASNGGVRYNSRNLAFFIASVLRNHIACCCLQQQGFLLLPFFEQI
jgi:hypothetical protein